jgi:alkanesulfonate monooxygenase SsuD/methylene tetrahydromethanopterin reductase-like flavin-dependent oxidoreductase (luciferase family)
MVLRPSLVLRGVTRGHCYFRPDRRTSEHPTSSITFSFLFVLNTLSKQTSLFTAPAMSDSANQSSTVKSVSFSQALLHFTSKLNVIAALLPGPWNPAVAAKQIASIDNYTGG